MTTSNGPPSPEAVELLVARLRALVMQRSDAWLNVDVTLPQLRALFLIGQRQPLTVSDLAALLDQRLAAVSALVTRLARAGWVRRSKDPTDRRRVLLALSEDGAALLRGVNDRSAVRFATVLARMSPQGRQHLAVALDELVGLFSDQDPAQDRDGTRDHDPR
jgi:DNA-binding MarR family transcriptional regulator